MCALLKDDDPAAPPPEKLVHVSWVVHGVDCANSAAKFWMSLIDEATEDYPVCTHLELSALLGEELTREQLHPADSLARSLEALAGEDFEQAMRQTLAELEILGPPSGVQVRVLSGPEVLLSRPLPADCLDVEILPHLLVWLLEWAELPSALWNAESATGRFVATDPRRLIEYTVDFTLVRRPVSEGLDGVLLTLAPSLAAYA